MFSPSKALGIPENYSQHGGQVDHLLDVVHYFMLALGVGWTIFFLYCLWRFWHRRNPKASYHGVKNHISTHLEIGVVIVEAVLLLGFAFPLWAERVDSFDEVQTDDPVRVRCIGYQFAWNYHYPGADGKFGRIDRSLVSTTGDPCVDPNDPNGFDDFTSAVLKLPVDRPAILQVTSTDVIHNYAIVPMRIQQDAMPGKDIPMWFTPTREMETFVVCAQLCGEGHANMVGTLQVIGEKAYDKWAEAQTKSAAESKAKQQEPVASL